MKDYIVKQILRAEDIKKDIIAQLNDLEENKKTYSKSKKKGIEYSEIIFKKDLDKVKILI